MIRKIIIAIGVVIGVSLFLKFPDLDIRLLGIGAHRNFLFHSCSMVVVLYFIIRKMNPSKSYVGFLHGVVVGCGIGIGIHLLLDFFQSHPVKYPIIGSLVDGTSLDDRLWLGLNSAVSFLVSLGIYRRLRSLLLCNSQ